MGEGLGRRPRHPDRGRASRCCAWTACARSWTSTRASTARTRWSPRSTTACTARAAPRRRSTPRCTASWMPRTSTTCIPTPASRSRPPKDGEKLTKKIFGDKVVWVPWRRPGFQLGPRHRRDQGAEPARRSAASSAGTASPRGATRPRRPRRTRCGSSRPPQAYIDAQRQEGARSASRARRGSPRCPRPSAARRPPPSRPTIRGIASHDKPMVGHFTDDPRVLEFLASAKAPEARRARHELPRPLPAHQGQADAARPARGRVGRGADRAAEGAARGLPRRLHRVLRRSTRRPSPPRSAAPTRSSCSCPASACSATARTSRPPASPASSTSTRST